MSRTKKIDTQAEPNAVVAGVDERKASAALHDEVQAKLLALGYSRLRLNVVLTVVVTLFFHSLMLSFLPRGPMMAWLYVLLLIAAARYVLHWVYRRRQPDLAHSTGWAVLFMISATAAGASWAFGPATMMATATGNTAMLLIVTLFSVSAVAMTSLSAHLPSMLLFISSALMPTGIALTASPDPVKHVTAFAVFAGMVMLLVVGRNAHETIKALLTTELRLSRTVDALKIAHDEAEAASLAKSRFLGSMSHELRTPLNAVIGAAQLLETVRTQNDKEQHLIDAIKHSGSNLLHLIEGILDLSRIEAGALKVSNEDFNLLECVDATVATAAVAARIKGLSMAVIVDPMLPMWRRGDAALLRQVLLNLFGNAVKFTVRGEVTVRIAAGADDDTVVISVIDTGIGIPESALGQVFAPFSQVDTGSDRRFSGSGLGLAIVRQLVEAMHGRITVESELGAGSRFDMHLSLPHGDERFGPATHARHRVAWFEPHETSAEALAALLDRLGCNARRCQSRADLVAWLHDSESAPAGRWLLINCDAPAASELLECAQATLDPARIIGMTNSESHGADSPCRHFKLQRHLVKPVLRPALVSCLTRVSSPGAGADPRPLTRRPRSSPAPIDTGGVHVLVVEDDLLNQTIVCGLLAHAGYTSDIAVNGASALTLIAERDFDMVLMDWHMPDMDGLEVTRRLRAGAAGMAGRKVPIVALTANAFAEDRQICIDAGMNDYLTKPVNADDLVHMVTRWTASGIRREDEASAAVSPVLGAA